jgi:hypothetical protein
MGRPQGARQLEVGRQQMEESGSASKRLARRATTEQAAALVSCAFWAMSLGLIVLFSWMAAVGNLDPADVVPLSGAVAALVGLWSLYSWVQRRRSFDISRHPQVVRQRERRNF